MTDHNMVMAFDFGTKNIGIAIGQRITCTAKPLTTLTAYNGMPNWQQLNKIIQDWEPTLIIVGLPLNMDQSEQPLTHHARQFAKLLYDRFNIKVELHDERLSTVEARSKLFSYGGYRAFKKKSRCISSCNYNGKLV